MSSQNLRFYSLAAASHDRQSGAARKAILCYQDPNPAYNPYMPQSAHLHPGGAPVSEVPPMIQSLPPIAYTQLAYQPEPAQFANAGPPGYAYNPASYSQDYTANQGSFSSDQVLFDGSTAPSAWRNRSEWSFPTTQYDGWQPEPPQ